MHKCVCMLYDVIDMRTHFTHAHMHIYVTCGYRHVCTYICIWHTCMLDTNIIVTRDT